MALKLDMIISHVEENIFKIKSNNSNNFRNSLLEINNSLEIKPFSIDKAILSIAESNTNSILIADEESKVSDQHQLIKIIDQKPLKRIKRITKNKQSTLECGKSVTSISVQNKQEPNTINKRSKQQRIFNTFVRESINQLLGPDFMRTHDVQDIDSQVMEMIRKEAVEHYLPDNIRPRRAWHLAKASLRTLNRTLNNRKPKA